MLLLYETLFIKTDACNCPSFAFLSATIVASIMASSPLFANLKSGFLIVIFHPALPFNCKVPFVLAAFALMVIEIVLGVASVNTNTFSGMLTVAGGSISKGR